MSETMKYSEYEKMYPGTIILRKEGTFYNSRNDSARVLHALFDFRGWKSSGGNPIIGFRYEKINEVCDELNKKNISYIVISGNEMVQGENFGANNQFYSYKDTSVEDLPVQKTGKYKKSKSEKESFFTDENEKRLNSISITYLERLVDGVHPVYNTSISGDSVVLDENVTRCFSFVLDVLKRLQGFDEADSDSVKQTIEFVEGYREVIEEIIKDADLRATDFHSILNSNMAKLLEEGAKISTTRISNWLLEKGYLERVIDEKGNSHRQATEKGVDIGIKNITVKNEGYLPYTTYTFSPDAQRFVYMHLNEIATFKKKNKVK